MERVDRQLGQLLVDHRLMTKDDYADHLVRAESSGTPLPRMLIDEGRVRGEDILAVIAGELNIEYWALGVEGTEPEPAALRRLPVDVARQLDALPVKVDEEGRVVIAVPDPFNQEKVTKLRTILGADVVMALTFSKLIGQAIDAAYTALAQEEGDGGDAAHTSAFASAEAQAMDTDLHVNELLSALVDRGGSDLHLTAGSPPQVRIHGELYTLDEYDMLLPASLRRMIYEILTGRQREELEETRELDCSHPIPGKGRFRVNVFFQRDSIGAVMRAIPSEIQSLEELGMPRVMSEFATLPRGLVLVTGPTGAGKSTTLASVIDLINATRHCHIMTVEDPIEFMHSHRQSIVNQREVGSDTLGFAEALRHALRQDPDVILVGEMRDLETISTAITAAETGHLVLGTLHTQDAPQSIDRMIDVFPSHQQQQVRVQLGSSIQAIVSQQLLPTVGGQSRIAAVEVMVANSAIRNLVREGKTHQIPSIMQAGGKHGMQTMDQSLASLVRQGAITLNVALERAQNPDEFMAMAGSR